jgi:hypothetical protein
VIGAGNYRRSRHEGGHAAAANLLFGPGTTTLVTRDPALLEPWQGARTESYVRPEVLYSRPALLNAADRAMVSLVGCIVEPNDGEGNDASGDWERARRHGLDGGVPEDEVDEWRLAQYGRTKELVASDVFQAALEAITDAVWQRVTIDGGRVDEVMASARPSRRRAALAKKSDAEIAAEIERLGR